jgi:hypothetical protein
MIRFYTTVLGDKFYCQINTCKYSTFKWCNSLEEVMKFYEEHLATLQQLPESSCKTEAA